MTLRTYSPGVYGYGRHQPERGYDFNTTVVASDTVLVIDPVAPTPDELAALRLLGSSFVVVILNADHERASADVAAALGAQVYAPRADVPLLRCQDVTPFDDGYVFPGGFVAHVFSDLKTPGESVLVGRGIAVVGDAVIADPVTGLRLVPPQKIADRAKALASLDRLALLDFDGLYTGDGFALPQGGRAALRKFLTAARL